MNPNAIFPREQLRELREDHAHEIFAIALLLCTPTDLSRAWTRNEDTKFAVAELDKLPLSDAVKQHGKDFITRFVGLRPFFEGIANVNRSTYDGPEPHPRGEQAARIIGKLRELDQS